MFQTVMEAERETRTIRALSTQRERERVERVYVGCIYNYILHNISRQATSYSVNDVIILSTLTPTVLCL